MSLIGWLFLGVILGLAAHWISGGRRASWLLDMILGAVGAVSAGLMFWGFGGGSVFRVNLYSMVAAAAGAMAALLSYHALFVYPGDLQD